MAIKVSHLQTQRLGEANIFHYKMFTPSQSERRDAPLQPARQYYHPSLQVNAGGRLWVDRADTDGNRYVQHFNVKHPQIIEYILMAPHRLHHIIPRFN